jgi:DNA-directed RNA polymerase specialized sigma24 family protein
VKENTADRLLALLGTLPARDRELVHLREVEGLGEKECSVLLGQPVGTLKSRLHRIKRKLYLQMMEEDGS